MENYHVIELVGEGSFGKVYKGRRKYTGQVSTFYHLYHVSMSLKQRSSMVHAVTLLHPGFASNISSIY